MPSHRADVSITSRPHRLPRWKDAWWRVLLGREHPLVRHVLSLLLSALVACSLVALIVLQDAHLQESSHQIAHLWAMLPHA